jgi:hypothetical protein
MKLGTSRRSSLLRRCNGGLAQGDDRIGTQRMPMPEGALVDGESLQPSLATAQLRHLAVAPYRHFKRRTRPYARS